MRKIANYVNIPKPEWIRLNNLLSAQYKSADPDQKTDIIEQIFRLNIPLFKSWNVFDTEDRPDFEQQAFLWTWRALENFNPEKGAFVAWLRWFVLKAWTEHQAKFDKKVLEVEIEEQPFDMEFPDHIFWKRIKKAFPEDWELIKGVYLKCEDDADLAKKLKISISVLRQKKSSIFQLMTLYHQNQLNPDTTIQTKNIHEEWLTIKEFANRFRYTIGYVRNLVHKKNRNGYYFEPSHLIHKPVVRIHYRAENGRLIYPIIRKNRALSFGH